VTEQLTFTIENKPPAEGFPMLQWTGKRPYISARYYPANHCERYGNMTEDGWMNRLYLGDNLKVMTHLLKEFRGKVDLVYIDPPFNSNTDYKKKIALRGQRAAAESTTFDEKQYGDIWTDEEYLQFMYDRLLLMRELMSDKGSIYVHLDEKHAHYIRLILDEVFGTDSFRREIVWDISVLSGFKVMAKNWIRGHDTLLFYSKSSDMTFNKLRQPHRKAYFDRFNKVDAEGRRYFDGRGTVLYLDEVVKKGKPYGDVWDDIMSFQQIPTANEKVGYPTQKPQALLERLISASSNPGDLVFDCFMGSGTTQAAAMKLGRRFIGADINRNAVQTTAKRLIRAANEPAGSESEEIQKNTGFDVYCVSEHDVGCDSANADIVTLDGRLVIRQFHPNNLLHKLSGEKIKIADWRQLVESVMIDWNYDGVVMKPSVTDVPGNSELVEGEYDIPINAGTIKVKITDLLSESLFMQVMV